MTDNRNFQETWNNLSTSQKAHWCSLVGYRETLQTFAPIQEKANTLLIISQEILIKSFTARQRSLDQSIKLKLHTDKKSWGESNTLIVFLITFARCLLCIPNRMNDFNFPSFNSDSILKLKMFVGMNNKNNTM